MPRTEDGRRGEGLLLVVSLVIFGAIAIGLGYLLGEYALNTLVKPQPKESVATTQSPMPTTSTSAITNGQAKEQGKQIGKKTDTSQTVAQPEVQEGPQSPNSNLPDSVTLYRVQVGAFQERANAERLSETLKSEGYQVYVTSEAPFKVQVGAFSKEENAQALAKQLKDAGYEAFVAK
ncbi:MAG TPA: hypothetical protein GX509_09760 [Firmicutes bacterium]|nr:hypothetical protein [Bacillota bacterium]HHY99010.1 hypothetical protein [Bacillota bacterium]